MGESELDPRERALIDAFIVPRKRPRDRALLSGPRRGKLRRGLDHLRDLDQRYTTPLPSHADVCRTLQDLGAPQRCYVLSSTARLDGRDLPLREAIDEIERSMCGALVSCVPGTLGYYYGESGERRLVLCRE